MTEEDCISVCQSAVLFNWHLQCLQNKNNREKSESEDQGIFENACVMFLVLPLLPAFVDKEPERSPERRCSSRTFRYGYLVTT